jgi:hypothetical protein
LEESKRSIRSKFQSGVDEQFRELSERESIIEEKEKLLRIFRSENEQLRNRITVLEKGRLRTTEAGVNQSCLIGDAAAKGSTSFSGETQASARNSSEYQAYSHRIRNRHNIGLGNNLQASNGSPLRASEVDKNALTTPATMGSAYSPRNRRIARAKENSP